MANTSGNMQTKSPVWESMAAVASSNTNIYN